MANLKPQELSDAVLSLSRDKNVVCLTKAMLIRYLFPPPPEGIQNWQAWKRPRERVLAQVLGRLVDDGELKRFEIFTPPLTDWSDGPVYSSDRDGVSINGDTQRRIHHRWMNRGLPKTTYAYRHTEVEDHFARVHIDLTADPGLKATSWIELTSFYLHLRKRHEDFDWSPWWRIGHCSDHSLRVSTPLPHRFLKNLVRDSDVHAIYFGPDTEKHQIICVINYNADHLEKLNQLIYEVRHWITSLGDGDPVAGIQLW